uniref:Uncharacterized protein n=1 Tax=Anguilla anguilla TaxID=7936 RepID=A0A0E9PWF5_ANGAN
MERGPGPKMGRSGFDQA